jgi:hypothetical protein
MRDSKGRFVKGHKEGFKKGQRPHNKDVKGYTNKGSFKKGFIPYNKGKKSSQSGSNHYHWQGGRVILKTGYIEIYMPNHPYARRNYVFEHRLVMEVHIGRHLTPKEVVHHINGNPSDNRIENLMLFANNGRHLSFQLKRRD